jgi:hypothetical protein
MFVRGLFVIFRVPYIVKDDIFAELVARVDVVTIAVLSAVVDPLNVPPGAAPLMLLTFNAKLEMTWKRPVPATSKVVAGAAVPTPTFDVEPWI